MLSKVLTAALYGIEGRMIIVETDITKGLPSYNVVGLGDMVIKEAGPRVRAAIINSGIDFPRTRITVNLSPASFPKEGSHFDMPLALGILSSAGIIPSPGGQRAFFGELSMNGDVVPVRGILPLVICAMEQGAKEVFVPAGNADEAALAGGVDVYPVRTLREAAEHLYGSMTIEKRSLPGKEGAYKTIGNHNEEDFADVAGQDNVKRAMVICAAGGHGLMMSGSPGAGKTMLARRLPGILPPLSREEMLEVTKIYSVAGLLGEEMPMITERPFRSVSHDITRAALLGGGAKPVPGELSLAHQGVLFMDELPMFSKNVIESLRRPLEDKEVVIKRHGGSARFPASAILLAAANPCPCGHAGDQTKRCTCTAAQINAYERKISDMILDRIDMHVFVQRIRYDELSENSGYTTEKMRDQVIMAREIQKERFGGSMVLNSSMDKVMMDEFCRLDKEGEGLMKEAYDKLPLTMRTYVKAICVARTIADLDGSDNIKTSHLAEALHYRSNNTGI